MADESSESARLAVLIDADNARPSVVEGLLAEVAKYGVAGVRRIYGEWTTPNLAGWKAALPDHSIQPVQQFRYTVGKNAARISEYCERIRRIEGEVDDIHDAGITALFRAASADGPQDLLRYLARREVFGHLERTVDHFDDVANEIEAIVVEHV